MDCALKYHFRAAEREAYQKSTMSECHQLFLHNHTFYGAREYNAQYWLPTSEAVHLSANNTVQGASTHTRSIPFHIVIKG